MAWGPKVDHALGMFGGLTSVCLTARCSDREARPAVRPYYDNVILVESSDMVTILQS